MTTDQIIKELDEIAMRNPTERDVVEQLKTEARDRNIRTIAVEGSLHEAIKIIETRRKS